MSVRDAGREEPRKGGAETVLLAEDEYALRESLALQLDEAGYSVLAAGNGEEALSLSEGYGGDIHLLLTDVMMPVMNGKELAERLCVLRPDIRVLFISGYRRTDMFPNETCEDAVDWLPKPFTAAQLQSAVRRILDAPRAA